MKVGRVGGFEGSPTGHRSVCDLAFVASWTFKRSLRATRTHRRGTGIWKWSEMPVIGLTPS